MDEPRRPTDAAEPTTGFLHPGAMGASIAAACRGRRFWVGEGRSDATRARAEAAGLTEVATLVDLVPEVDLIVSVCPPEAARDVAAQVEAAGFEGRYVDANAIAPRTAREIAAGLADMVDGGIVGPPVSAPGSTRLYLSGGGAEAVADRWAGSDLDVRVVTGGVGAASAVKMCFAGWTKGTAALLLSLRALAVAEGVEEAIVAEWAGSNPDLLVQADLTAPAAAPKAWRWIGEMDEIAAALADDDLPSGFHLAADVYRRLAPFKDARPGPDLDAVIEALVETEPRPPRSWA